MADNERMTITDVRVLAALAHPARLAILHLLLTVGDATATQCSAVVGESPSSCSYHLRHLEKFGLVERVESDTDDEVDGRTRRWRSVATGFDFGEPHSTGSPELVAVSAALITTGLEGRVTSLNAAAERLTGWSAAEAIGQPLGEVFHLLEHATDESGDLPLTNFVPGTEAVFSVDRKVLLARDKAERWIEHLLGRSHRTTH